MAVGRGDGSVSRGDIETPVWLALTQKLGMAMYICNPRAKKTETRPLRFTGPVWHNTPV